MILFFHGLDSSEETAKFTCIANPNKVSQTVEYRDKHYDEVSEYYNKRILETKPTLLVGHSMGGYWALIKSYEFGIPCVIVNPQLFPDYDFLQGYTHVTDAQILGADVTGYIECGDEIIDVEKTIDALKAKHLHILDGGHHRVERLDNINTVVEETLTTAGI